MTLDSNKIMKVLPHRFPFQLVDRITACEPGVRAEGRKCVSVGEPFFCGHFPQLHVMPGVLILEAMAQVGGVKNARFKRPVTPGEVREMECVLTARRGPVGMGKAVARVDGQLAATAELTFAVR